MIALYLPYALVAILLAAVLLELRTGRIPNWLTLLPFLLFAGVIYLAEDRMALLPQIYLAAGVFVAGLALYAVAGFGAGAVKLMTGVALFVPLAEAFYVFLVFFVGMFVFSFLIVQIRKAAGSEDSRWHVLRKAVLPMSLPIAVAGILSLFVITA